MAAALALLLEPRRSQLSAKEATLIDIRVDGRLNGADFQKYAIKSTRKGTQGRTSAGSRRFTAVFETSKSPLILLETNRPSETQGLTTYGSMGTRTIKIGPGWSVQMPICLNTVVQSMRAYSQCNAEGILRRCE